MSSADMQQLASALNFATLVAEFPSKGRNGRHSCEECGSSAFPAPRSWSLNTKQIVAVTSIILVDSCLLTGTLLRAFFLLLHFSFGLVALSFILAYLLRVCAADLYMKGSDVFAKYNSMFGVQDIYYRDNVAGKSTYATSSSQSKKALQMNILKMPTSKSAQSDIKIEVRFDRNESERSLQWVLLTGATGFLGSLLLRDLLLHREPLSIMGGVIVVCRSKGDNSGKDRISNLLSDPMFSFLSEKDKNDLVLVLEGDVTLPNAGINSKDLDNVCNKMNVSHVFHCAAAVNFTQAMEDAASSNILTSLNMQSLTKRLRNKTAKYVHISTAFVHGDATGTQTTPLPEELFQLKNYDALDVYQSMLETQSYASTAMDELGFPNTYTFSKSICEHLLVREQGVETIIIRPSIIGPALQEPFEGWAGMMPSTIVAVACLYFKWQWNFWCCGEQRVPVIPVDVVCKFILAKAFNGSDLVDVCKYKPDEIGVHLSGFSISSFGSNSVDDNRKCKIYNAAWDTSSNQTAMFRWRDFAAAITHFGSVLGYTSRSVAYIAFSVAVNLLPRMSLTVDTFRKLHQFFIKAPINSTIAVLEWVGWNPHSAQQLSKLNTFIDLPLLLFPFTNNNFYFRSDLVSPDDMNGERYLFSCIVAADRFLSTVPLKYKRRAEGKHSSVIRLANDDQTVKLANDRDVQSLPCVLVVGGRQHKRPTSDIWWALTQPRGDIFIRAVGWIWIKILRACCISVTIDAASFSHLAISRTSDSGNGLPHVILAPTHRSFFDFLLISYVYFSVPELLGPDIPHIVAADDFARLPMLGWAARNARALFLRRGRGVADPALNDMIRRLKVKKCDGSAACIEVFIEGSRSRDRRFLKPKTGFLRCLAETGGDHVVVPISISYERIPEQSTLSFDAERGSKVGLRSQGLLWWLKRVFTRKINIGRVHIAAVQPLRMEESSGELDFHALSRDIQRKQQLSVHVSNYHIEAGANVLGLKTETLREALSVLGCNFWPSSAGCSICSESGPDFGAPRSLSEQWTVMLQYGHLLSPLFRLSHPYWCEWLNPSFDLSSDYSDSDDPAVQSVASALSKLFDTADNATEMAIQLLLSNGYQTPKIDHVMQSIESYASTQVPPLLLRAAVSMKLSTRNIPEKIDQDSDTDTTDSLTNSRVERDHCLSLQKLTYQYNRGRSSDDMLGSWGFPDSGFVLHVSRSGANTVMMKGKRYGLCGKPLAKLIPFIEAETHVRIDPLSPTLPLTPNLARDDALVCDLTSSDVTALKTISSRVSDDIFDRARHGTGHSQEDMYLLRSGSLHQIRIPDAVVWPLSEKEVELLVGLARTRDWCLIPFGGGTNVSHATRCPTKESEPRPVISMDMREMKRVLWVNEEDGLAHIEAGITGSALVHEMKRRGYTIGHEPDSIEFSTLGGWIATKASGMKRSKYGNIEDIVKSVRMVGSDGILWQGKQEEDGNKCAFGRESRGIDLCSLTIGSEGCFGVITSAIIRIWPLPECVDFDSVIFPTFSHGLGFVRDVAKLGSNMPSSVRLLDNAHFRLGKALRTSSSGFGKVKEDALMLAAKLTYSFSPELAVCATITYEGNKVEVHQQMKVINRLSALHGGAMAGSKTGRSGYELTFVIAYLRDFAMTYHFLSESFETFAPWSKLESVVSSTKDRIREEHKRRLLPGVPFIGCRVTQLYHEGACLYFYLCMNVEHVSNPSRVFSKIEHAARSEILEKGGSLSHHHGIGKLRASYMTQLDSEPLHAFHSSMKKSIDPDNIFGARNGAFAS